MRPFTVLDVVRYENFRNNPRVTLRQLVEFFILEQKNIITSPQDLPTGFWRSYNQSNLGKGIDKTLITIDIEIVEGEWQQHERAWLAYKLFGMMTKVKIWEWCFGGFEDYLLSYPNEVFFTFCEILRRKFPNDTNMHCIMDDIIKCMM